jgi:hypothetical protein
MFSGGMPYKGEKKAAKTPSEPGVNLQNKGVIITNFVINAAQSIKANGPKHIRE